MKKYSFIIYIASSLLFFTSCERDVENLDAATYPTNGEVFIDAFSSGLNYAAFGGSVPTAFQVDNAVTYNNSSASMRFDVPNANDSNGAYAGGSYFTNMPRNLSGYDALTFWAKSSQTATIDVVGFGNDFGENKYQASISGLQVSTAWKKYIIPIPDQSKLTAEKGMFFISEGPENNNGYSFWIDEVKFEKLGTIAHPQATILNGANQTVTSFIGVSNTVNGLTAIFNMPNGTNQAVNVTPYYFTFSSSNTNVATVSPLGVVNTIGAGTATITGKLGSINATGSLIINSPGSFVHAPTPTRSPSSVTSLFSDAYTNVPVDYYNGYWAPYQTTQSADFEVAGDHVLNYTNFNFVGVQFSSPVIDATMRTHLHLDLYIPSTLASGATFKVQVVDFGADGVYGGGNDTSSTRTFTAPTLQGQNWVSLDIPFSSLTGLASRSHLGQIIFEGTNIINFYTDNIYFYNDGSIIPSVPTVAAPTPTTPSSNVISIFSDAYTNVAGTNFNPNWGQATQTSIVSIGGNNTFKMQGLNYQGIQLGSNQNVSSKTFLHVDFYTANSTSLKIYLISPGPVETPYTLTVPSMGGWQSIDIPLTSFSPVDLSNVFQLKFDGNGDIYMDNIYFK
ncbi:glycosyl hydrolase family 16 [Flavobacterium croceum]|uniref:glycosyl hydrolase family 16 n=1 Tax=Flavobacterium croceum TaxID=370975 RepID=UPI0024A83C88|nr:glycosyl hydrolase family 16 [Flavobacterium croceum]